VDFLAKTTNLHKNIVIKLLFELHQLVNKPEEIVKSDRYSLSMKQVIGEWANEPITHPQIDKLKDALVGSSDIIEIIGRANSGKSYFCFAFILNCLQRGLHVIFLDSNQNF
jgi:polynucleotide 5'-kinase involved in rRNA processing